MPKKSHFFLPDLLEPSSDLPFENLIPFFVTIFTQQSYPESTVQMQMKSCEPIQNPFFSFCLIR